MSYQKFKDVIERAKEKHDGKFVNEYVCPRGHSVLTIDLDCGNTPMNLQCHSCPEPINKSLYYRPSMMTSRGYPEALQSDEMKALAEVEFYRPKFRVAEAMDPGPLKDYVFNGGLMCRIKGRTEPMLWV